MSKIDQLLECVIPHKKDRFIEIMSQGFTAKEIKEISRVINKEQVAIDPDDVFMDKALAVCYDATNAPAEARYSNSRISEVIEAKRMFVWIAGSTLGVKKPSIKEKINLSQCGVHHHNRKASGYIETDKNFRSMIVGVCSELSRMGYPAPQIKIIKFLNDKKL